jgi:glycosyltransferase involved in cell wall biosynthesis
MNSPDGLRGDLPGVSVYIPCYNGAHYIGACLQALLDQTRVPDEIIVIDDGSTDGTGSVVQGYPGVILVQFSENRGLSAARNAGVATARHELVASLDADCVAEPDWLAHLVEVMKNVPNIVGAGGDLRETNTETVADRYRCTFMLQSWGPERVINPPFLCGANTIYRRSELFEVDGYADIFRTNGEDVDLCKRIYARGHKLLYWPKARVNHMRKDTVSSVVRMNWAHVRHPLVIYYPPVTRPVLWAILKMLVVHAVQCRIVPALKNKRFVTALIAVRALFEMPWLEIKEYRRHQLASRTIEPDDAANPAVRRAV